MPNPHPLPPDLFTTIVQHTPLISIDLILRNHQGEVLLGKRLNAPAKDFWFTPGGRIYKNETMEDAFRRIAHDELGISASLSNASFIGTFEHFYDDSVFGDHISTHYVVLAYTLSLSTLHITINDQHQIYSWFDVQSLLADPSVHTHVKWYFT